MTKQATKKNGSKSAVTVDAAAFLIANVTSGEPGKKKSDVPVFEGHAALADKAHNAYKAMKDAEADFRAIEGQVIELTDAEYAARSQAGDHTKSMNMVGLVTPGIQMTYQDKFSALPITAEAGLKGALGDTYDTFFEQSRKLSLKEEATDDATVKMLLAKLGEETFKKIFDIKVTIVAKADMDRKQFDLPEGVATMAGLKQAKASLKVLKGE